MALTMPHSARATAVFNPTAPDCGFLQPLFSATGGDNRHFVQYFTSPDIVEGFHPVTWPGRDFEALDIEPLVTAGGPTLWGFQLGDGRRIVEYWPQFRAIMRDLVRDPALTDRPLLLFDIVDTLDIEEAKRETYLRAYRTYAEMSAQTAQRWRDRSILEPALRRAWLSHEPILRTGDRIGPRNATLRARLVNNVVQVYDDQTIDAERQDIMQRAYQELARAHPELFPISGIVATADRARPRKLPPAARRAQIAVVTVGDIARRADSGRPWLPKGVRVEQADYFHPDPIDGRHAMLTIVVGALRDWPEMIAQARRLGDQPAIIVSLSTSATTLLKDLRFQADSGVPTVSFFAPFATSPKLGRDPVKTIEPLIGLLMQAIGKDPDIHPRAILPAEHNLLVREPLSSNQSRHEVACRLAARAIKAGGVPGGRAFLYSQGAVPDAQHGWWDSDLSHIFEIPVAAQVHLNARRAALLLLVERQSHIQAKGDRDALWDGVRRIFEIRGWRIVDARGWSFGVETDDRRFQVAIAESKDELPSENAGAPTPGLTRASLLVIHTQPKREQLLVGNRGQHFHASIDDIGLMKPGTDWVWPIVKRQLFDMGLTPSPAALRLCATLIVEAVRLGNIVHGVIEVEWDKIAAILSDPDCERFMTFDRTPFAKGVANLFVRVAEDGVWESRVRIELEIERRGPVVAGAPD